MKLKTLKLFNGIENKYFNKTALIHAAYKGHKKTVDLLLNQEGIDIDSKDI